MSAFPAAGQVLRYDPVWRGFHWLVVALVLLQFGIALGLASSPSEAAEARLVFWHFTVGSTVLVLMLLRLAWRLTHTPPPPPADLPPGLQLLARATHWLFYAVLIILPIGGWAAASAYGATVYLLGLIPLPHLVAESRPLAESIGRVHIALALALLALIALHVAGAMFHAFVKRDGVMQRMLPGSRGA